MVVLVILGLILVGVMQFSRGRTPATAIDKSSTRPEAEPKPKDVARRLPSQSDNPRSAHEPAIAEPAKAQTR